MTSLPDVIRTGHNAVMLLLIRTVLFFTGIGIVLSFVDWSYNRALLWANVMMVIVDVITLFVLLQLLACQDHRLCDLLAPSRLDITWGLLAFIILQIGSSVLTFIGILVAYQGDPPASEVLHGVPMWMG